MIWFDSFCEHEFGYPLNFAVEIDSNDKKQVWMLIVTLGIVWFVQICIRKRKLLHAYMHVSLMCGLMLHLN